MMEPKIIEFPKHLDSSGTLFVADEVDLPFVPKRVFWMNRLQGHRGGHALKTCEQIIVALHGQFNVHAFSPLTSSLWALEFPRQGLYLPIMTWRDLTNFTHDSIALVLCSKSYDPDDYINESSLFLKETGRWNAEYFEGAQIE